MLAGTDAGTGVRGHVRVWGGDSAVQAHSMVGVRGGEEGHTQEHTQERTRECCTYPLATYPLKSARSIHILYPQDVGEWIGASSTGLYNFSPNVRTVPLEMARLILLAEREKRTVRKRERVQKVQRWLNVTICPKTITLQHLIFGQLILGAVT